MVPTISWELAYGKIVKTELESLTLAITKFVSKPFFIPTPEIVLDNLKKKKGQYSSPFYTHIGGYKMCLSIDTKGWGDGKDTHVSVGVYMMKGEFDSHLKWLFKGEITVRLVNQKEIMKGRLLNSVMQQETGIGVRKMIQQKLDGTMLNSSPTMISTNLKRVKSTSRMTHSSSESLTLLSIGQYCVEYILVDLLCM